MIEKDKDADENLLKLNVNKPGRTCEIKLVTVINIHDYLCLVN